MRRNSYDMVECVQFLKKNGWKVVHSKEMVARISLMYAECMRKENS